MVARHPRSTKRVKFNEDDSPFDLLSLLDGSEMLDPSQPRIRLIGEVTQEMAREFIKSVGLLKKRGEKMALIEISSPGGCLYSLFQMLNCMDSADMLFATYNSSHAYSAGGVLLAAGAKGARFVAPLSSTMLHPMSTGIAHQQIDDVVVQAGHDKELNDMLMDRLAKYMNMSRLKLNKELQKPSEGGGATLWMTPARALEMGVADIIGIPTFFTETNLNIFGADPASEKAVTKLTRK